MNWQPTSRKGARRWNLAEGSSGPLGSRLRLEICGCCCCGGGGGGGGGESDLDANGAILARPQLAACRWHRLINLRAAVIEVRELAAGVGRVAFAATIWHRRRVRGRPTDRPASQQQRQRQRQQAKRRLSPVGPRLPRPPARPPAGQLGQAEWAARGRAHCVRAAPYARLSMEDNLRPPFSLHYSATPDFPQGRATGAEAALAPLCPRAA